jgi:hypothetical protein
MSASRLVWVCLGRRAGEEELAYLQTFNLLSEAKEFISLAKAHASPEISSIIWEAHATQTLSATDALAEMESLA